MSGATGGNSDKVILIGLDGMMPEQVLRYRRRVPELDRLLREGFFSPAISSLPTDTPTNWTTIATGAWSGTHGIVGFGVHQPGMEAGRTLGTFNSRLCKAEYFWQAAERQGKRSILVNYPTAFPLTLKDGVVVGGDGLMSPQWTRRSHEIISNCRDASGVRPLALCPAVGWKNVPSYYTVVAEGIVDLDAERRFGWGAAGVTDEGIGDEGAAERRYALLVKDGPTPKIVLSRTRDVGKALATMAKGEWSGWVEERFGGRRALRQYKVVDLTADGRKITIYGSMAATPSGWAYPRGVEERVLEHAGAYVEALELSPDSAFRSGWFGRDEMGQVLDIMQIQADWTADCAAHLANTEQWDVLFAQYHVPDGINHDVLMDMEHEDPGVRRNADKWLGETFRVMFGMVDKIRRTCADDSTAVCVVSDHGNMPVTKWVNTPGILMREGWLHFRENERGLMDIDPETTRAWFAAHHTGVWINLEGRQKGGVVAPGAEYEALRSKAVHRMRQVVDPETGEPVFASVGRREDFQSMGVWGDRFADVITIANPYYLTYLEQFDNLPPETVQSYLDTPDVIDIADAPLSSGLRSLSAVHWHMPTASVGYASNRACFILTGPGVAPGTRGERVNLVDVAPTLAHCIGIAPPEDAEGRIVREAFA